MLQPLLRGTKPEIDTGLKVPKLPDRGRLEMPSDPTPPGIEF
jgi:hypothetical protein